MQAAGNMVDEFQDGIFFVPLASIQKPEHVAPAVARAVGLVDDTAEQVFEYFKHRRALVLLDNFEQVLDAAPFVTELLRRAPHIQTVVTSREALGVYGEHLYPVTPLSRPDVRTRLSAAQLELYESTKLFVERMRALVPHIVLDDEDATTIGVICASLEGLPLAIELAAARVNELSLQDIAAQLSSRLGFLTKGPRDLPPRHRTLRGLLDWSYHLLTESERAMFARLAVFAGGWTTDAALRVTNLPGSEHTADRRVQDALAAKFLIQPTTGVYDPPRFGMLETLREYARERLDERGETERTQRAHAEYFAGLIQELEPALIGGQQQNHALQVCEAEQYNLRDALTWATSAGEHRLALQMVKVLWRYWGISSRLSEGREWMEQVLSQSDGSHPRLRAQALYGLSKLALFQGDLNRAQQAAEMALANYRAVGDEDGVGWSVNALGEIAANRNENARAEECFREGMNAHRKLDNKLGVAKALDDLGRLAIKRKDYAQAAELLEESLELRRERGSPEGIAVGLATLGEVMRLQGSFAAAERYTNESLARYRQLNHTAGTITCLYNLAQLRQAQQDPEQAVGLYLEALGALRDLENEESELTLSCLAGLAQALYESDKVQQAAQAVGAYEQMAEQFSASSDTTELSTETVAEIREILGEREWLKATATGRALAPEELPAALFKPENDVS
jgi:predicted ATPase